MFYQEYVVEYSRIAEKLYLPNEVLNLDNVLMATPEKALVDCAYLRKRLPFADELETNLLNRTKLIEIATAYPEHVWKRIEGWL
ncbi:MAG: hypothetical protein QF466_07560 [Desulfobacterales bacterium]|jgi:hypothetical protein|nr:hypothetical protein [Desulfobacterales bacterium]MDP6682695.1 hypothetical protein [Desulfobacterales bacterium]MDP6808032.1 hypothetical protein [Desulfobacterales bacterium]|tara:strand:- start:433 stop:684 length:252 start_codon:yes stop_codon:yes gene_type:complete